MMGNDKNLKLSLFLLRLGVFIVMFMWSIDKLLNPDHAARVFEKFYFTPGLSSSIFIILGLLQLMIVLGFGVGFMKKYTYGFVFIMHLVSTLSSYQKILDPWSSPNLLFYASFPMLAAIAALYLLRKDDILYTIGR